MAEEKSRTERFDDAFKLLLVIMTVSLSMGIGFFKETLEFRAFSYTVGLFVLTIALWIVGHLHGGKDEYGLKIAAWWSMMLSFAILFARLSFTVFLLPPLVASACVVAGLILTLPLILYLKDNLGSATPKNYSIFFVLVTIIIVIIDILYYFGLVSFPI
jgi:hypothetical protein